MTKHEYVIIRILTDNYVHLRRYKRHSVFLHKYLTMILQIGSDTEAFLKVVLELSICFIMVYCSNINHNNLYIYSMCEVNAKII